MAGRRNSVFRKGDIVKFKGPKPSWHADNFKVYDAAGDSVRDFFGGWWPNDKLALVERPKRTRKRKFL